MPASEGVITLACRGAALMGRVVQPSRCQATPAEHGDTVCLGLVTVAHLCK